MKEYFKIDEIFRCRFIKYEVCPPTIIWKYIKQQINNSKRKNNISDQNK